MNVGDLLNNLSLDTWYKVLMALGIAGIATALIFDVKAISNPQLLLLSTGLFLFGLGEWKNHKTYTSYKPPNIYTGPGVYIHRTIWNPDLIGITLDVLGLLFILIAMGMIIYSSVTGNAPAATPTPIITPVP